MTTPLPPISRTHSISECYALLAAQSGVTPRDAQAQLSELISDSLIHKTTVLAEAPTGTGKTLAYLIGGLAAHRVTGVPVVIATATKALQTQLLDTDLPKLVKAGIIGAEDVALAKGQSNYFCTFNALEAQAQVARLAADYEAYTEEHLDESSMPQVDAAYKLYAAGGWKGDLDLYPATLSVGARKAIMMTADTCMARKCEHYRNCAFFKAKEAAKGKRIVVTNHDLLLADLSLVAEGAEPTLGVSNYYLVVDEAHHFPQKAIQVGSKEAPLTALLLALPKLVGVQRILKGSAALTKHLKTVNVTEATFDKTALTLALRGLLFELSDISVAEETGTARFPKGEVPPLLADKMQVLLPLLKEMGKVLQILSDVVKHAEKLEPATVESAREAQSRTRDVTRAIQKTLACLDVFLNKTGYAKWVYQKEDTLILHAAPLEGAEVLRPLLWDSDRVVAAALLSATLQDVDGFVRYRKKIGAPANAKTQVLPHTFRYEESQLVVADMQYTPKFSERKLFMQELKQKLPNQLNANEGTLVLCPSWAVLNEILPVLRARFGTRVVKAQGEQTLRLLVADHAKDIASGQGSMLVGVATMSEGLDLPGNLCTHVVVLTLPFAVPSTPVEEEVAESLGSRYFAERSLPDALVRLTQMVGRLNRRESDRGRVTIFDIRLRTTSYGRQMLKCLPPFQILGT